MGWGESYNSLRIRGSVTKEERKNNIGQGYAAYISAKLGEVVGDRRILFPAYILVLGEIPGLFPARREGVLTLLIRTEIGEAVGKGT